MSLSEQVNIGQRILVVTASTNGSFSQTSAAAATTQDGLTIDRQALGRHYYSCKAVVSAQYNATTGKTATLAATLQHSSDGTSWDTYSTGSAVTFGGVTTDYDVAVVNANLVGARRYLRVALHAPTYADCSSGQGVFNHQAVVVFGGADQLPAQ